MQDIRSRSLGYESGIESIELLYLQVAVVLELETE